MADIVTPETRSRMMSGIQGKNTRPEKVVRSFLHARGFRFRFHHRTLPFTPDLVLSRYRLVIFVHGCFWHRHTGCRYAAIPSSNAEKWQTKFRKNVDRDQRQLQEARQRGWRTLVIWECGIRHCASELDEVCDLITSDHETMTWPAAPPRPSETRER